MKKYNQANLKWVIIGIVLPILVFFSVGGVLAYFSATIAPEQTTITAASVNLVFNPDVNSTSTLNSSGSALETSVYSSRAVTHSSNIIPGDTVTINGSIKNNGNVPIYTILQFEVYITPKVYIANSDSTFAANTFYSCVNGIYYLVSQEPLDWATTYSNYYTLEDGTTVLKYVGFYVLNTNDNTTSGNNVSASSSDVTRITYPSVIEFAEEPDDWATTYTNYYTYSNSNYVQATGTFDDEETYYVYQFNDATTMSNTGVTQKKKFQVSYTFTESNDDNLYKNASVETVVTGLAIQTANIASAKEATRLLIKQVYDAYSSTNKAILLSSLNTTALFLS